jgi:Holliday junction DNA helicase RuvA
VIAWVEGVLREKAPTRVVVDVQGVGYELLVSLSTFAELPDTGKTVALHVHTHVREEAIQLFGFATPRERAVFELLLKASRVGPKLAQTILSGVAAGKLVSAIGTGDLAVLRGIPGVGPKMAERIAVELRDRAAELARHDPAGEGAPIAGSEGQRVSDQVMSALLNLGYPRAQAERVVESAASEAGEEASIEELIRVALRRLAR